MYGKERTSEKDNHGEDMWVIFGPYQENSMTMLCSILHLHAKMLQIFTE